MFPTLTDLLGWGPPIDTHSAFVALGMLAAGVVFAIERKRRGVTDPRIPYIVLGALIGAGVLSRLGTWAQHLDPSKNLSLLDQLAYGNASILSGLVGAWLGVHVAKRIVRYPERTGDLFAPAVALAMAIGRFGCYFTEAPGGVALHASFLVEVGFHAAAFAVLWFWLRHRPVAAGETLTLYIAAYGIFRFAIEFWRGNEVAWLGLTRPQLFLAVTIPLLLARIVYQAARGAMIAPPPTPQTERMAARDQPA